MIKPEKLEQRYVNASWGEVVVGHGQRGSNIEEWRRIKILGQEKHTSRRSKLMNFEVGHGERGSNIEEWRRIKILGQEKHTSRGSKLMNFD